MINFSCENCGQKFNVEDKHTGKKAKCSKCGEVIIVPSNSDKITFQCESCGQTIKVSESYAGRKGKCPKCSNPIVVPSIKRDTPNNTKTFSVVCSMCEKNVQIPETSRGKIMECPGCGSYIETSSGDDLYESNTASPLTTDENSYEEDTEEYEESEGENRRLIFIISGAAVAFVLILIVLAVVIRSPGSSSVEETYVIENQQQAVDQNLLSQPTNPGTRTGRLTVQQSSGQSILVVIFIVSLIIGLLQIISMWIVFNKAGEPGWAILIPFYGSWVWAKVGDKPGWMGLMTSFCAFIPYVGPIIGLILTFIISIGIARAFDYGIIFGIGLCFLPFIFYPILAFSNR